MSHLIARKPRWSRREFLRQSFWTAGAAGLAGCGVSELPGSREASSGGEGVTPPPAATSRFASIGPLQAADANGLMLPAGFTSRVVAVSGQPTVAGGAHIWHNFPDGGATYRTPDGGWVYTSNSEVPALPQGGCGAIKFDAQGNIVGSYAILTGTRGNCAGGKMPWGTWMSCEEVSDGVVYECDPFQPGEGVARPVFGLYNREAIVVDPVNKVFYSTEDAGSGRFYRYIPNASDWPAGVERPSLAAGQGRLQVARFAALASNEAPPAAFNLEMPNPIIWEDVMSPDMAQGAVRTGLGAAAPGSPFNGGEGLWYFNNLVYFSTKGDSRIWVLDIAMQTIEAIYDFATATPENAILTGVDNLTVSEFGDVLVAEDGFEEGDPERMQICVILPDRSVIPLLKAADLSPDEFPSEICGPAFSPDGARLYFSAQRNGRNGSVGNGITFEVSLPFSACPSGSCP